MITRQVVTWEPLSGKPVGGRLADGRHEPNREAAQPDSVMGTLRQTPLQDADGTVARQSLSDYVMPEPATQAPSPSREVPAVIEIEGGSHRDLSNKSTVPHSQEGGR